MVSTPGRRVLRDMSMEDITPPSQSDDPSCPACTRSLNPALALQRDHERVVICPHCGWEMHA
jgi:predicted RNA-binding Zn-ribbon protein involved in translation (DUF1610 family)